MLMNLLCLNEAFFSEDICLYVSIDFFLHYKLVSQGHLARSKYCLMN